MKRIYYIVFLMIIAVTKVDAGSWGIDVSQVNGVDSISSDGRIYVTYESRTGAVWTGGTQSTVVTNYLKTKVGKFVVSRRHDMGGYIGNYLRNFRFDYVQLYDDRSYKSGSASFTARVYITTYVRLAKVKTVTDSYKKW